MRFRIATFNLENFDETGADVGSGATLAARLEIMRPQIKRLDADVVCFQEVNGQERPDEPRDLHALTELLAGTPLEDATLTSTRTQAGEVYDQRNLVVASHLPVVAAAQVKNDYVDNPIWQPLTANPPGEPRPVTSERPVLHVELDLGGWSLHVINVHLKSKLPTTVAGQKVDRYTWRTSSGWAEGAFLSSMKRMAQAVEVRVLVDHILDLDPTAWIVVAGDFNAEPHEVPVLAIRGRVEDTGNGALAPRELVPVADAGPVDRHTLIHHGRGELIDHMLVTRQLMAYFGGVEIHNEVLHDESIAFAVDRLYPESDHAPLVATFELPG